MPEIRKDRPKRSHCKNYIKKFSFLINELEKSLAKSEQIDQQFLLAVSLGDLKNQNVIQQLQEAEKENKHLLSMLQLGDNENYVSRSNSASSCSTMSLVHLQYKYEELLDKYNGLLKILEMRLTDIHEHHKENGKMKEEIEALKLKLKKFEANMYKLKKRIKETRDKKNNKILRLKTERDTLRLVHNRLVSLLNEQLAERDNFLNEQIKVTKNSEEALLMREVRKNNLLSYENFQLQQQIEYLQSILNVKSIKSKGSSSM